jgi:poly [ADP-ribose] polymerase
LIIPPYNASYVTGRAFGNGIYGAHHSTKSLNYSTGWWSGSGNKYKNCFLFIVNFAMGKADIVQHSTDHPRAGCDSIWAKSGGGNLYNDEYIVFKLPQATITHLIEMKK